AQGRPIGYLGRTGRQLLTFPPREDGADPLATRRDLAAMLAQLAQPGRPVWLQRIDADVAHESPLATELLATGFMTTHRGLLHRGR
ncbi:MAG: hypothetical protein J5I93_15400, partial [Pirellulaceae bacterium]|nr:hypothetical protein [Pirellulaceae bacterium]